MLLVSDFRLEFVSDLRLLRFPNRDLFRSVNGPDWVGLFSSSSSSSSIWSIFSSSSGCSSKSEINNRYLKCGFKGHSFLFLIKI